MLMTISIHLTISRQNVIIKTRRKGMDYFFEEQDIVTQIVFACVVKRGEGSSVHKNRPSHGLALHFGDDKTYTFDTGENFCLKKGKGLDKKRV